MRATHHDLLIQQSVCLIMPQVKIQQVVNTVFNSCDYMISHGAQSWLVDCGDVDRILRLLGDGDLCGVLLTHAHFDHIYGLNRLLSLYPQVMIHTSPEGRVGLLDDKINLSRYHETPFTLERPGNIRTVDDGEMIELFDDVTARAVYTPGHSPDCVTWVMNDAVFTGDSYIPGIKTVTIFPHADKNLAARSESLIRDMARGRVIYPGHPAQNSTMTHK